MNRRSPRERGMLGIASLLAVGLVTLAGTAGDTRTLAAWNDAEWTSASEIGALDCKNATGRFATRGEGRMLSGALLGYDLDSLAAASGTTATNNGSRVAHQPPGAVPAAAPDAYAHPLDVSALRAVSVDLGGGLLQLPLDNATGVIGQFGQARSTGAAAGASGAITDGGGIALEPGGGYPTLGSLRLQQLLAQINPPAAAALGNVADVSLEIGAVAGRASLDGCAGTWRRDLAATVDRDHLVASLDTRMTSPTVTALYAAVKSTVDGLESAVLALPTNTSALNSITGSVVGLVNTALGLPVLNGLVRLKPGSTSVVFTEASASLAPLRSLLDQPVRDEHGIVGVNLAAGVVVVDTAALLAQAYPVVYGGGLNALPPNTQLLVDQHVIDTLTKALGSALNGWIDDVNDALLATVEGISLRTTVSIGLQLCTLTIVVTCVTWTDIGTIRATAQGSLAAMRAGDGVVTVDTSLLDGTLLGALLNPLVNALTSALVSQLDIIVGQAVNTVVNSYRSLPAAAISAAGAVTPVISAAYGALYLTGIVSVLVNAQNDPSAPGSGPEPADWSGLAAGRYDVAALRIGVLGALGANDVRLYLGRGSVGPICRVPGAGCAGY